jgi:uncharacterized membrane protein HdeD (DUF308 family)
MARILALNWWALALRGVFAVIFGLAAFFLPGITLYALTILFGAYAFVDGVVSLTAAIRSGIHGEHWWELLFEGIAGIAAAVVTAIWPTVTLVVLVYIIAGWAFITGIFEIAAAIRLRRQISGEWLLILAGIASVIFGVLLFAAPLTGAVVIAWWMGAYVFLFGLLMLGLAFRLRHHSSTLAAQPS